MIELYRVVLSVENWLRDGSHQMQALKQKQKNSWSRCVVCLKNVMCNEFQKAIANYSLHY